MLEVKFYDTVDDSLLKFAVIISQSNGKWVFCKHKERDTYEAPGGHREVGEDILETAKRELQEETGAIQFDIKPICVYSVTGKNSVNETGEETFGLLCFAEITEFSGKLESEIEKVELMDELPESWTYPMIQPKLIEKYLQIERQYYSQIQLAAKQTIEYIKNIIKPGMNLLEIRKLCEGKLLELGADSFWYWDVGAFVFAGDETTVWHLLLSNTPTRHTILALQELYYFHNSFSEILLCTYAILPDYTDHQTLRSKSHKRQQCSCLKFYRPYIRLSQYQSFHQHNPKPL